MGTISAEFDFYNNWVDIFPEEYNVIQVKPGEERQEVLIHGMLNKEILVDILKHFTLFMEIKKGVEVKIVARYNQYRAVCKIIKNFRAGNTALRKRWCGMAYTGKWQKFDNGFSNPETSQLR